MLEKYKKYLQKLDQKITEYFKSQEQFIVCKPGCAICCKNSYYIVSQVEYDFIREGFKQLNPEKQDIINEKAIKIYKDRKEFLKINPDILKFTYKCPFLEDASCSLYEYRPMICRSHGLLYKDVDKENKINLPYCVDLGLNYANVWDGSTKSFSLEKMRKLGLISTPEAFDLSYSSMMKSTEDVEFGDVRMIIEWIIFDIPNYEELIKV
ncbi:MAG: hypothetical protein ACD_20C00346G0017 [uncultured bacterium]|nr:MAG: hypothetical protein ACD_20C00346G0017 [uncultured bacterium]